MNILIITQYFHPENFRINDFAKEFKNRGHKISVLTSIPNYPKGEYYKGYGIFKKRKEIYKGITIYRALVIPRGSGSNFRLAVNYISFVIGGILTCLSLFKKQYDIIFVFEPSPITVCLPAIFLKKFKKIPICFWVLDLWPESVVSAGNLSKNSIIPKLLTPLVQFIYNNCDKILVSSRGFIKSIKNKNIDERKIEFFPQWAEQIFKPVYSKKYLLDPVPKNSFKILFAGNIGEAQDFPSILKAAKFLKDDRNIQWIILGAGRKEDYVKEKIKEYDLSKSFHLLGSYPLDRMPYFYSLADCLLFSLKREFIFSITIPAKVQSYLACKKPIIAMVDGEAAKIIKISNAGLVGPSEEPQILANNVYKLSKMNQGEMTTLGNNSLTYYKKEFERTMLMNRFELIFEKLISINFS